MKNYEDLKEMLCDELDKIAESGQLTPTSLDMVEKLTHSLKSISTIMAMEDYSEDDNYYDDGNSMARGRGRNARRDSMGRYSSRGSYARGNRGGTNRGGRSNRSYDGYSGHEDFKEELHDMMEDASNEQERMAIRKVLKMMEE